MSQTATYRARIATVQRWLRAAGWTPDATPFDHSAIAERARVKWYAGRGAVGRARAEHLVTKAARLLRGETVKAAGRPAGKVEWHIGEKVALTVLLPEGLIERIRVLRLVRADGRARNSKFLVAELMERKDERTND